MEQVLILFHPIYVDFVLHLSHKISAFKAFSPLVLSNLIIDGNRQGSAIKGLSIILSISIDFP